VPERAWYSYLRDVVSKAVEGTALALELENTEEEP